MNTKQITQTMTVSNRYYSRGALATAVAISMAGSVAYASHFGNGYTDLGVNATTIDNNTNNSTKNYIVHGMNTLTFNGTTGSMGHYYGNFTSTMDGQQQATFNVFGNVTLHGNVGLNAASSGANGTGNWTLFNGNTLTLSENVTVFNAQNMTLEDNTTLNLGSNSTTGVNRDSDHELIYYGNISVGGNSTINVGNGTTIKGLIYGSASGKGTLNILGNFTHDNVIGAHILRDGFTPDNISKLAQINISADNTFTMSGNVSATNMNINGTVIATGNITSAITMGASGILNLNTETSGATNTQSANVTGAIQSYVLDTAQGTLNINGTWATNGEIGQGGYGLAAINIDSSANSTSSTGFTTTFTNNVNATTITIGTGTGTKNATLAIQFTDSAQTNPINITGNIVGGGNATSTDSATGGRLNILNNATVSGNIGGSSTRLADIRINDGATLTILGASRDIYANNITLMDSGVNGLNATLAFNGTGTATVYGEITGELTEGEGLIDINTGIVSFKNTVGSADQYISGIDIADGSTMTTSSNIYVNATIKVRGTLNIDALAGITIEANDANHDG